MLKQIDGDQRVRGIRFGEQTLPCDAVAFAHALRSETQLADLLGCEFAWNPLNRAWLPQRDSAGRSSVEGVYLAGDGAGIMGDDAAQMAGECAALALLEDTGVVVDQRRRVALERRRRPSQADRPWSHGIPCGRTGFVPDGSGFP